MPAKKKKAAKVAVKKKKAAPAAAPKKKKNGVPDFVKGQFCITYKSKSALASGTGTSFVSIKDSPGDVLRYPSKSHAKAALENLQEEFQLGGDGPKELMGAEVEPMSEYFANSYEAIIDDGQATVAHYLVLAGEEVRLKDTIKSAQASLHDEIAAAKAKIKETDVLHKEAIKQLNLDKKKTDADLSKGLKDAQKALDSFQKQMKKLG